MGVSDVVAAGAITGAVGVIGNVTTYLATKRQADTAIRAAQEETERVREQYREAERQNRQGTYHRLLAVLDRFDMFATGYSGSDESFEAALAEYNFLFGAVHLFGAREVRDALAPMTELLGLIGDEMTRGGTDRGTAEAFKRAYGAHREAMVKAAADLTEAMRADVTRGVLTRR